MRLTTTGALLTAMVFALLANTSIAEEQTLKAVMPWSGEGQVYRIGESTVLFLGYFEGIMYVETSEGSIDEAFTRCPVIQNINLETSGTSVSGYCTMTQSADDSVYAKFVCDGKPGECQGTFELTGGTGIFEDASGSSELTIRTPLGNLIGGMADGSTVRVDSGVAILSKLTYTLPKDRR